MYQYSHSNNMSGIGSFSQEAYEQLQAAYAAQMLRADEQEAAGVQIGKETLNVETAPVRNVWLDKTGLWQYPDGKGAYQDVEQQQQDLLAALRNERGEVEIDSEQEEEDLDAMSDEEIEGMIDEILADIDDGEETEEEETVEDSDLSDLTDEELDALIDQILTESESDEEEMEAPSKEDEDAELSAEEIAARIEQLKAELAALTEVSSEEETEEADETPEETEGDEEEGTEDDKNAEESPE